MTHNPIKKGIVQSFNAAFHGFWETLRHESSFKYMCAAGILVIAGTLYFKTSRLETTALFTMIFAVLVLELMNTAIERLLDFINPKYDERIRLIKDVLSAIVLLVSIGASVIGYIIFSPYLTALLV